MAVQLEFEQRSKSAQAIFDSLLMIKRSSTHILRNTDQLLGTFFQPIMFLILFSAVFGGAIGVGLPKGVSYLEFLMAGIIVQTVSFGSTTTAIAVCNDLQKGIIDRFRSSPMNNVAVLNGHVVSDLLRNTFSTIIMLIVGLIIGFRSSASLQDWLVIAGLLALFTFSFSWLAVIVGVLAKSVEAVQWLTFVIVLPLTFASSAFVPLASMNKYLKVFAVNQPITHVIEAIRALFLGQPTGNHVWLSVVWSIAILAVAIPLSTWLYSRKSA